MAKEKNLYFWRDNAGHEVDVIIENYNQVIPVEIKSGQTITKDYFKGIKYFNQLTRSHGGYVVYAGELNQKRSEEIEVRSFKSLKDL